MNKIEQRKILKEFWDYSGYNPSRIDSMKDNQVYAVYMRQQGAINDYLLGRSRSYVEPIIGTERDQWTDDEWNDYAFEEN